MKKKSSKLLVKPIVETLYSRTVDVLRQAIIEGDFSPGERLIDRELCEKTGVGRSSIREALRQLEAEYLIEYKPNCGPTVTQITKQKAMEIYELRFAIESLGIRLFTINASKQAINQLEKTIDKYEIAMKKSDVKNSIQFSENFFQIIFEGSNNELAFQFSKVLRTRMHFLRALITRKQNNSQRNKYILTFKNIIKKIKTRNPDTAVQACKKHIDNATSIAFDILSNN